jgi:transposase-like protein
MPAIVDKDEKCRLIETLIASGKGVCESCREVEISEKTFYRWRKARCAR